MLLEKLIIYLIGLTVATIVWLFIIYIYKHNENTYPQGSELLPNQINKDTQYLIGDVSRIVDVVWLI